MPHDGGYLDQPAGLMDKLKVLLNVYRSFRAMIETKYDMKKWSEENPDMMKVIVLVEQMRAEHGNS